MSSKCRYKCRLNCRLKLAPFMVLKMSLYVPVKEYDGKMSVKKWLVVGKMSVNDAESDAIMMLKMVPNCGVKCSYKCPYKRV